METLTTYLLPLLILPISIFLFLQIHQKTTKKQETNLPGSSGWPFIGENMDFAMLGAQTYVSQRMKKYSQDVFQTSLLGEKMAVFCGAHGHKFLFTNETKLLTSWWPESMKKALLFPEFVNNPVKEVTSLQRNFIRDILKPEALKRYISEMDCMTRSHLENDWVPYREVSIFPLSKKYTFALACKLFMSIEDEKHVEKLADHFTLITNGMFSMPINFPGTAYNGAIKGGKLVRDELMNIIVERKKKIMKNEDINLKGDLLSQMLVMKDENGEFTTDMEISNSIIGLLVASYETTSSMVTFVLKYLAEIPEVYEKVLKEQMSIVESKAPGELLSWEDIEKMKYSWNMAREALRLIPPAQGSFREVITDFTYAGYTIPKGWKTFWMVHTTHKNPKYFPDPERFDPSRFEGSGPAPYTFVPFGGGPRMCPGKEYARLEVLVFMHNVVTRFRLEKLMPNEKIIFHSSPTPSNGLPVRLIPHNESVRLANTLSM
ncbi:unnamed protein product [Lactuca saligna]|uniref:Beta-amyrin 28-oxidase n=1 Tax=Lactuca saligna TaxID=75948 RepID=A0AA36EB46_LACSI|nr:unnamed protein product [Lactuca saligna]